MKEQNLSLIDNPITFESLCQLSILNEAFMAVKKNKGAPGIDGVTINDFESHLDKETQNH